ncbi:MAG: UDP-N-acetylmuramate dehydrogenase [Streptosporangiaceae bacterium]
MVVREQVPLSRYTTLRLGGPAVRFAQAVTDEQLIAVVRAADQAAEPVLVLGSGSNLVVADSGFPGTVVQVATRGVQIGPAPLPGAPLSGAPAPGGAPAGPDAVTVQVAAGEDWDAFVERCIGAGLSGLECLSGIPGQAGATPIQNVGAYGHEVAETIVSVRAFDRLRADIVELASADCGFGYRTSAFKRRPGSRPTVGPAAVTGRFVVLSVTFALRRDLLSAPVGYAELARALAVPEGGRVPLAQARAAVLALRRGKGMVVDPADPDTRSAGSFFTNPVLSPGRFAAVEQAAAARAGQPVRVPRFAAPGGQVKVPAAWLIEQAGFGKGYPPGGAARISAKHTLALTNPGGASTAALLALAREIRDGVRQAFGVELVSEPVLVGTEI